jgi:hypothetical protein
MGEYVSCMGEMRATYTILIGKYQGNLRNVNIQGDSGGVTATYGAHF